MQEFFEVEHPETHEPLKLFVPQDCPYFRLNNDIGVRGPWFYIDHQFHWRADEILHGSLRATLMPVMAAVASEWWVKKEVMIRAELDRLGIPKAAVFGEASDQIKLYSEYSINWGLFTAKPEGYGK